MIARFLLIVISPVLPPKWLFPSWLKFLISVGNSLHLPHSTIINFLKPRFLSIFQLMIRLLLIPGYFLLWQWVGTLSDLRYIVPSLYNNTVICRTKISIMIGALWLNILHNWYPVVNIPYNQLSGQFCKLSRPSDQGYLCSLICKLLHNLCFHSEASFWRGNFFFDKFRRVIYQ